MSAGDPRESNTDDGKTRRRGTAVARGARWLAWVRRTLRKEQELDGLRAKASQNRARVSLSQLSAASRSQKNWYLRYVSPNTESELRKSWEGYVRRILLLLNNEAEVREGGLSVKICDFLRVFLRGALFFLLWFLTRRVCETVVHESIRTILRNFLWIHRV